MWDYPERFRHVSGAVLEREPAMALIGIVPPADGFADPDFPTVLGEIVAAAGDAGLVPLEPVGPGLAAPDDASTPPSTINNSSTLLWVRSASLGAVPDDAARRIAERLGELFDFLGPAYRLPGTTGARGVICPRPNLLLLRPHEGADAAFEELIAGLPVEELEAHSAVMRPLRIRYFRVPDLADTNALLLKDRLLADHADVVESARLEHIPLRKATAYTPNEATTAGAKYIYQWNLGRVEAEKGWNIQRGSPAVCVGVVDDGFDLTHEDLSPNLADPGIDAGDVSKNAAYVPGAGEWHGTHVTGVATARMNNALGIAGVAGRAHFYPVKFNQSASQLAFGITHAADWVGGGGESARAINLSLGWYDEDLPLVDRDLVDDAIKHAHDAGCVICAATGNGQGVDPAKIMYPARNPHVLACGATQKNDLRWKESWYESNYGDEVYGGVQTGVSVVAPGVGIWSTVIDTGKTYWFTSGTSFATPHVAALAALLIAEYGLSNEETRAVIERTAIKVHDKDAYSYADVAGFPNGTRHEQVGYGQVSLRRALGFADVYIRDWPGDDGTEPSTPPGGNFWCCSDIVVRPADDDVFDPGDPAESARVTRGQDNWLYVRVRNNGPAEAKKVSVNTRIVPWAGTLFSYPEDWTQIDATHVEPIRVSADFPTIAAGTEEIAKFKISADQVETLWGWVDGGSWHPCILAEVSAKNDYAWESASTSATDLLVRRNNLAQKNLSVVGTLPGATVTFPFVIGEIPREFDPRILIALGLVPRPTPIWLHIGAHEGPFVGAVSEHAPRVAHVSDLRVDNGRVRRDGCRWSVELQWPATELRVSGAPGLLHEVVLEARIPEAAEPGENYRIDISTELPGVGVAGGVSVVFRVADEAPDSYPST